MTYDDFKHAIAQHLARNYSNNAWPLRTFYEGRHILHDKLEHPDESLFNLFVDELQKEGIVKAHDSHTIYFTAEFCLAILQPGDKPEGG
jgi:hypothetical protein